MKRFSVILLVAGLYLLLPNSLMAQESSASATDVAPTTEAVTQLQPASYFDKGYFGSVDCDFGFMAPHMRIASGLNIINGYNWRWFGLGLGVGYCSRSGLSRTYLTVPVFINLRAEILDKKVTPIVALNLGYAYGVQTAGKPADEGLVSVTPIEGNMAYGEIKVGFGVRLATRYVLDFMWGASLHVGDSFEFGPKFCLGFRW